SRKVELLHELKQGSGMARRQEILKTLWRLDRQSTMLAASTVDRALVPAKATPQAQRPTAPVPYERQCAPEKQDSPTQASDIVSRYGAAVPSLLSDEQLRKILN